MTLLLLLINERDLAQYYHICMVFLLEPLRKTSKPLDVVFAAEFAGYYLGLQGFNDALVLSMLIPISCFVLVQHIVSSRMDNLVERTSASQCYRRSDTSYGLCFIFLKRL